MLKKMPALFIWAYSWVHPSHLHTDLAEARPVSEWPRCSCRPKKRMSTCEKLVSGDAPPTQEVSCVIVCGVWWNGIVCVMMLLRLCCICFSGFVDFWWNSSGQSDFHWDFNGHPWGTLFGVCPGPSLPAWITVTTSTSGFSCHTPVAKWTWLDFLYFIDVV